MYGEHVYFVGHVGVLAHNNYDVDDLSSLTRQGTQLHHPTPRMYLRAMRRAGYNVGSVNSAGQFQTVRQNLKPLLASEHVGHRGISDAAGLGIHQQLDEFIGTMSNVRGNRSLLSLQNQKGNTRQLARNLSSGRIQPSEMFDTLTDFYRMNYMDDLADEVQRIRIQLEGMNPGAWR